MIFKVSWVSEDSISTMMSPLKLSVIVCGAAAGLAVAPYVVKQILPPDGSTEVASAEPAPLIVDTGVKLDLPVAGASKAPEPVSALALAPAPKEELPSRPELHLVAPALPTPGPAEAELSLPSLANPEVASAVPTPSMTPTPAPTPAPTPEIPYRSEVETAQKLMKELGIDTGKIDGKLGPNTQAAVKDFQKKEGLVPSGEVTNELLKAMEKAVAALPEPTPVSEITITDADKPEAVVVRNSQKDDKEAESNKPAVVVANAKPAVDPGPVPTLKNMKDVRKLQTQLKEAGTYEGNIDGKWGDLTRAAMRAFQEKQGIEVTGRPNRETWLAMHTDSPLQADDEDKATDLKTIAAADEMEISSPDSTPTQDRDSDEDLVVSLNGDGVSEPGKKKPIPTPSAVSALDEQSESEMADTESDREIADEEAAPKVKVRAPGRDREESSAADEDSEPNDLAVAKVDEDAIREKLQKEIEDKRAQIQSVSDDSTYEVKKYAPKMLETVNSMVDNLKIESVSNNPAEARERLAQIDEELEKAKRESMKKKAGQLVGDVKDAYDELKLHFPERIKSLSLKNSAEKEQREELTELVAKVDLGFEAMEKDYENEKYEPIFKNAVQFRSTIKEISKTVAEAYVAARLEEKSVKTKLDDDDLEEIENLQKETDHLKAAEVLDKAVGKSSSKKS